MPWCQAPDLQIASEDIFDECYTVGCKAAGRTCHQCPMIHNSPNLWAPHFVITFHHGYLLTFIDRITSAMSVCASVVARISTIVWYWTNDDMIVGVALHLCNDRRNEWPAQHLWVVAHIMNIFSREWWQAGILCDEDISLLVCGEEVMPVNPHTTSYLN